MFLTLRVPLTWGCNAVTVSGLLFLSGLVWDCDFVPPCILLSMLRYIIKEHQKLKNKICSMPPFVSVPLVSLNFSLDKPALR